ncbi:hypothetical protein BDZ91DRAFT_729397, partial [Kalaharituber pfeilii]
PFFHLVLSFALGFSGLVYNCSLFLTSIAAFTLLGFLYTILGASEAIKKYKEFLGTLNF